MRINIFHCFAVESLLNLAEFLQHLAEFLL
jgi:hypothetical protein